MASKVMSKPHESSATMNMELAEVKEGQTKIVKWPGWPGNNVFRLIVPVLKVGGIIGRKGELVKKMCDETRAQIRVFPGPVGTPDRIVLISGKEEPDTQLAPAMVATIRVFQRIIGFSASEDDGMGSAAAGAQFCSIRLLASTSQAIFLIGKQGSTIKSIHETTGASVRVLPEDEVPSYATFEERIIDIHGEADKVLKALEAVLGHLRKFLIDHTVIPLFEKIYNETISQDRSADARAIKTQSSLHSAPAYQTGIGSDYVMSLKRDPLMHNRDPLIHNREAYLDPIIPQSGFSLYSQDSERGGLHSSVLGRTAAPRVTQMTQTMQVPISYAEDIIGVGGSNIGYIRRTSGASLSIEESVGFPDEITVEIKGTTSQVQMAQQLIQVFSGSHKEPPPSTYGRVDSGLSAYSQLADTTNPSSHVEGYRSSNDGGFVSSNVGGYVPSNAGGYVPSNAGGYGSSNLGGYGSSNVGGYGSSDVGGYGSSSLGGYNSFRL